MEKERPVIVTTAHRGVFFGYATDTDGETLRGPLVIGEQARIELRIYLQDGGIVTDVAYGPISGDEIEQEFEEVRQLYGEPACMELEKVE